MPSSPPTDTPATVDAGTFGRVHRHELEPREPGRGSRFASRAGRARHGAQAAGATAAPPALPAPIPAGPAPGAPAGAPAAAISETPTRVGIQSREKLRRRSLAIADMAAAAFAVLLSTSLFADGAVHGLTVAALPLIVVINKVAGLYDRDELVLRSSTLDEVPTLLQLSGVFTLGMWLMGDQLISGELARAQVLVLWALLLVSMVGARWLARHVASELAQTERCLVIGSLETAVRVREKMQMAGVNAQVVATLPLLERNQALHVGDATAAFRRIVAELAVDRAILAPVSTDSKDMLEVIRIAKAVGVRVSVLPRMLEVVGTSVAFDDLDGMTMLGVRRFGLSRSSRMLKRAFDVTCAAIGIVLISPLLLALALAVRLDSRGPVLFCQVRVGRDGRRFRMYKFRSMVPEAEALKASLLDRNEAVGTFKIADDPRITRVGRFIRRSSLDELPQLLNVLRGEMSLVGPRPLVVDEDDKVEGLLRSRLHLTPGMTGPWQVLGSARIPMPEMVKLDYLYVANWSLWTDVKLLLRTVPHILARRGR